MVTVSIGVGHASLYIGMCGVVFFVLYIYTGFFSGRGKADLIVSCDFICNGIFS